MPKVGNEEFAYTPEGIEAAKKRSRETGVPMSNAMERTESYQIGGIVSPAYKEGGEIDSTKSTDYTYKSSFKTAGFDKAKKAYEDRQKAEKGMSFKDKIAAAKARKGKPKSNSDLIKEAAARHKKRIGAKKK